MPVPAVRFPSLLKPQPDRTCRNSPSSCPDSISGYRRMGWKPSPVPSLPYCSGVFFCHNNAHFPQLLCWGGTLFPLAFSVLFDAGTRTVPRSPPGITCRGLLRVGRGPARQARGGHGDSRAIIVGLQPVGMFFRGSIWLIGNKCVFLHHEIFASCNLIKKAWNQSKSI